MKPLNAPKKHLIILADGQGTLFSHILASCQKAHLNAKVLALLSSQPKAPVLEKARKALVPTKVLNLSDFSSFVEWDQALLAYLKQVFRSAPPIQVGGPPLSSEGWVLLAGFLKKIGPWTLTDFKNRIINIHPSLLPRHGGVGMYGLHVHRAVIKAQDKKTGISIHFVSKEYDQGPLLAQKEIPVSRTDTPESLQKKVKKEEPDFYVDTLNKLFNSS